MLNERTTQRELAQTFGINRAQVSKALYGTSYIEQIGKEALYGFEIREV